LAAVIIVYKIQKSSNLSIIAQIDMWNRKQWKEFWGESYKILNAVNSIKVKPERTLKKTNRVSDHSSTIPPWKPFGCLSHLVVCYRTLIRHRVKIRLFMPNNLNLKNHFLEM